MLYANSVLADRIYKSIDAAGNVTYSSHPPKDAVNIEKIEVPTNYDVAPDARSNFEAIKDTADAFESERKQREAERKAAQEKEEAAAREAEKAQPVEKEIHYYPVYPPNYYPGHSHQPRPHHPKPKPQPKPRRDPRIEPEQPPKTPAPK
jgi:hypothetical protein